MYFGTLLQKGQLNAFESVELSRLVIGQNKKHLLDGWFKEGKVRATSAAGLLYQSTMLPDSHVISGAVIVAQLVP